MALMSGRDFRQGSNLRSGHHVVIGDNVSIGDDATLGHNVIIGDDVTVGVGFSAGNNVVIESDVVLGDRVKLGHNVVLKSGTRFGSNINFADNCCTTGVCILGDNVNVRTAAVISKGLIIEDDVFIGPGVMTNHTKHVEHRRPQMKRQYLLTRIGAGAIIGSNGFIVAGAHIPPLTVLGGFSSVVKEIKDRGVYAGSPLRRLRDLPDEYVIDVTSKRYSLPPELLDKYLPGAVEP